jgi:hypothetical protein
VLGTLVAANAPALQQLSVSCCQLGDAGMGPLVEALRHNTHLRSLYCRCNYTSEAFARDRLLPAVRANTSLRRLAVEPWHGGECPTKKNGAREAAALVPWRRARSSRARDGLETACGAEVTSVVSVKIR